VKPSDSSGLTVFLGIYNAERYLESLRTQLLSQSFQNFDLIVIDNLSTDQSWNILDEWKGSFHNRITLVRNQMNLGGGGNLFKLLSTNMVKSEWLVWLHQDDFYSPSHLQTLYNEIKQAPIEVVAICSGMGSMDDKGNAIPSPPRSAWLVTDNSAPSSFLMNLRFQTFSWPSSAFRTKELAQCFKYWHSPSFSDTETTLRLCAFGEFRYLTQVTMRYRENPESESHGVNPVERLIGAALGLSRVLTSEEFKIVLRKVKNSDRGLFFSELMSALEVRLENSVLLPFVKLLAAEECCQIWDFHEAESSKLLRNSYQAMGSQLTENLISNLSGIPIAIPDKTLKESLMELSAYRSTEVFIHYSNKKSRLKIVVKRMPLRLRIIVFRFYVRIAAIKQPNHYWNAFWK
jgi:glycosyltransferase involved in cell wall biosynthesis